MSGQGLLTSKHSSMKIRMTTDEAAFPGETVTVLEKAQGSW